MNFLCKIWQKISPKSKNPKNATFYLHNLGTFEKVVNFAHFLKNWKKCYFFVLQKSYRWYRIHTRKNCPFFVNFSKNHEKCNFFKISKKWPPAKTWNYLTNAIPESYDKRTGPKFCKICKNGSFFMHFFTVQNRKNSPCPKIDDFWHFFCKILKKCSKIVWKNSIFLLPFLKCKKSVKKS